jgi:hypothetical protein
LNLYLIDDDLIARMALVDVVVASVVKMRLILE